MKTINLNDCVEVILTQSGANILNTTNMYYNKCIGQDRYQIDYKAGDLYKDQLWCMIQLFSKTCSLGCEAFCESGQITLCS